MIPSPLFNGKFPDKPELEAEDIKGLCQDKQFDSAIMFVFRQNEPSCGPGCDGIHIWGCDFMMSKKLALEAIYGIMERYDLSIKDLD